MLRRRAFKIWGPYYQNRFYRRRRIWHAKGPIGRVLLGVGSITLLSTGSVLCDSEQKPPVPDNLTTSKTVTSDDPALDPSPAIKEDSTSPETTDSSALARLKSGLNDIQKKISEFEAPSITISPETFGLPPHFLDWVDKIRAEVSFAPGSVADEIWQESHDPQRNPEIMKDARVWIGNEISLEEQEFTRNRRVFTKKSLARYLGVREDEIDERDIPTIAVAGSGGGYRAMLGTTGYFKAMKQARLFDCVTYMAGVSGSCWAMTTYLTYGERSIDKMIQHFKARLGKSFTDPTAALTLFTERPTNKYLLRGLVERFKQGYTELGMVDIFGTLVASRILVPSNELTVHDDWLKLSNQRKFIDDGTEPLPIYTAVRHEIPIKAALDKSTKKDEEPNKELEHLGSTGDDGVISSDIAGEQQQKLQEQARREAWFQWFELTPYYVGCEEIEAWIPTFGLGRQYRKGLNVSRTPELKLPIILGIVGSAFCATLSHYYAEIRPFLPTSYRLFRSLDELVQEKDQDLIVVHPIQPASIPNFVLGLDESLPSACPESLKSDPEIKLMDGGMSNNIPFYPLLRRDVDIIIALDTSADIQTTPWFERTDGYAKQKGIIGWPIGAGWPKNVSVQENLEILDKALPSSSEEIESSLADAKARQKPDEPTDPITKKYGLGHCNIWIGTRAERTASEEPPPPKQMPVSADDAWRLDPEDGIMLIYLPLLPNPKVPGVVPETTEYMSTWNFQYTPEQIDKVVELAERNFEVGEERIRRAIRAVWQRKREIRRQRKLERRLVIRGRALVMDAIQKSRGE